MSKISFLIGRKYYNRKLQNALYFMKHPPIPIKDPIR